MLAKMINLSWSCAVMFVHRVFCAMTEIIAVMIHRERKLVSFVSDVINVSFSFTYFASLIRKGYFSPQHDDFNANLNVYRRFVFFFFFLAESSRNSKARNVLREIIYDTHGKSLYMYNSQGDEFRPKRIISAVS